MAMTPSLRPALCGRRTEVAARVVPPLAGVVGEVASATFDEVIDAVDRLLDEIEHDLVVLEALATHQGSLSAEDARRLETPTR